MVFDSHVRFQELWHSFSLRFLSAESIICCRIRDPNLPPKFFGRVRHSKETDGVKRVRFTDEQIIGMSKEQETADVKRDVVAYACKEHETDLKPHLKENHFASFNYPFIVDSF
ncbi:hypothetical protein [Brucella sp. 22210]|uniref:hypothetical protein n=1 Tax=Brucella sp. 22210 TaxID=3453892 RepID=UPI003F83A2B4